MTKTLSDLAMEMYQRQAYKTLKLFKKAKKKSWAALGINAEMEARIMKGGDAIYGAERLPANLSNIRYMPREIHILKAQTSHNVIAHVASIREQEKFRADPRFPLFQIVQSVKRYKEIFAGRPYLPIFGP